MIQHIDDPFNARQAYFLILIFETNSISKSGEKLGLSPVASSRLLQKYRKYFHDPLFVVSRGKLLPTALFLKILPKLRVLLQASEDLQTKPFEVRNIKNIFRFSCNPGFAPDLMCFILQRFLKDAPMASVEHISLGSNPISALMNSEIDVLIGRNIGLPPQAHFLDLKLGQRVLLCRKEHPLVKLYDEGKLSFEDIENCKRVSLSSGRRQDWRSPDRGLFKGSHKNDNIVFKTDRAEMAWMAMTKTDLIQVSTVRSADLAQKLYPNLTVIPVPAPTEEPNPCMGIIWSDITHKDPAQRWFRNLFVEWAGTTLLASLQVREKSV